MTDETAQKVVEELATAYYQATEIEHPYTEFVYSTNGLYQLIEIPAIQLWNSENECRDWDDEGMEELRGFIVRQLEEVQSEIATIIAQMKRNALNSAEIPNSWSSSEKPNNYDCANVVCADEIK